MFFPWLRGFHPGAPASSRSPGLAGNHVLALGLTGDLF